MSFVCYLPINRIPRSIRAGPSAQFRIKNFGCMAFPRRTWMYEFVMKTASYENSKTTFQSQLGELHTETYSHILRRMPLTRRNRQKCKTWLFTGTTQKQQKFTGVVITFAHLSIKGFPPQLGVFCTLSTHSRKRFSI